MHQIPEFQLIKFWKLFTTDSNKFLKLFSRISKK
jgi:hypothetical protein